MMTRKPTFRINFDNDCNGYCCCNRLCVFDIPIQVLLIIASAYATWIAKRVGLTWQDLEKALQNV